MYDFDPRWERNWRRFEAMARRGFKQFGRGFGPGGGGDWSGFGENFRIGRMLASGDLRLVALYFIEQQPRHGYDLIKAIEEKSGGFYSPSPGVVYPALTYLEEAGYVSSEAQGNKKLYTITEDGRAHLADNREAIESTLEFLGKAGERFRHLRENFWGGGQGGPDQAPDHDHDHHGHGPGPGHRHGPGRGDWPFSREQREQFEAMRRPGWPFPAAQAPGEPADRDIRDVKPEVNDARKDLKRAIKEAVARGEHDHARIADILHRAAEEIRNPPPRADRDEDEIDL